MGQTVLYIIPFLGLIGILFMFSRSSWGNKLDDGSDQTKEIAKNIADGAMACLKAEYHGLAIFVVVVAGLLLYSGTISDGSHRLIAVSFILAAICSSLAGFIGMQVATRANVRT